MDLTVKNEIIGLYDRLRGYECLRPGPMVNASFSRLVGLAVGYPAEKAASLLGDREIRAILPGLRQLCAKGEYELEYHWATQILESQHPTIELAQFPYFDNYAKLSEIEYRSLAMVGLQNLRRVLFIGSGPLPLSSIMLAREYGLCVDNLDNDAAAVDVSTRLISRLGLGDSVATHLGDAHHFTGYGNYDVIFLASLVGSKAADKHAVISRVQAQMAAGSLLVVRTAHGLRALLYPTVEIDTIAGLAPQVIIQPLNEVVNSVVVFEKPRHALGNDFNVAETREPGEAVAFADFCREMIAEIYHYPYDPLWHSDIDRAAEVYSQPRSTAFVVRDGAKVVASAAVRPYDRNYAALAGRYGAYTASVWRFFIRPHYTGRGLEALLQSRIEDFARRHGYTHLYAHDQRDASKALKKYIDNGFEVTYESTDRFGTVHFEKQLEVTS